MKSFKYFQPTEIRFGRGLLDEVGEAAARFGKRCLIVTGSVFPAIESVFDRVKSSLQKAGVEWAHFDGELCVRPSSSSVKRACT
jgi:alcohol dehydrogenase YqhD (iron-dependent ADH family)